MKRLILSLMFCLASLPSIAAGGSFQFPDFSAPGGLIALNGSAAVAGNVLRLTPNQLNQAGSAWYTAPVDVGSGFTTTFQYRMTHDPSSAGADGFAFVVQNDPARTAALGGPGAWMGYGYPGLYNAVAVEFDTYWNRMWDSNGNPIQTADSNGNHVAIHRSLGSNPIDSVYLGDLVQADDNPGITLNDGQQHTVDVSYAGGQLYVTLDGHGLFGGGVILDIAGIVGAQDAYVGFTAGTGALSQIHDINSWEYAPVPEPGSITLLGSGLLGLAGSLRRRIIKKGTA